MVELPAEFKPFFFVAASLLGVEIVYFLNFSSASELGFFRYVAMLALAVSVPMLVASCLAALSGFTKQMKWLLWLGMMAGAIWFLAALAAISVLAALIALVTSFASYVLLWDHYHQNNKSKES